MVGKNLSHYKILEELGRGGMGIVYKAEDTKLDRTVAIKVLPSAALASEEDRARFYREAKAAAQLQHPHIAVVHEIDEAVPSEAPHGTEPSPFIAMEFIEGKTLDAKIKEGPLKLEDAVRIASEIASALEAAHEKKIVHRDIKSQNVMLTEEGSAKVLDFGLAKTAQSTKLTRMGSKLGTIAYMSPEQARSEEVDRRTDIWSLGVVLYEMIAGKSPFPGDYEQAVVYEILNTNPEPLTTIRSGVPMQLEWMVNKLLSKEAEHRYQTAADLLADLKTLDVSGSGYSRRSMVAVSPPSIPAAPYKTMTLWVYAGMAVALAVGIGIGAVLLGGGSGSVPTTRFSINLEGAVDPLAAAWTPDGRSLYYIAQDTVSGRTFVAVYELDTGLSQAVGGTDDAISVIVSPDGRWLIVGDGQGRHFERVLLTGGQPSEIPNTDTGSYLLGAMSPGGDLYFSVVGWDLAVVSEDGTRSIVASNDTLTSRFFADPVVSPDGRSVYWTAYVNPNATDNSTGSWAVLEPGADPIHVLPEYSVRAITPNGYALVVPSGTLGEPVSVVPFDASTGSLLGVPVPIARMSGSALSANGNFVYQINNSIQTAGSAESLFSLEADGSTTRLGRVPGVSNDFAAAHGRRAVVLESRPEDSTLSDSDLYLFDIEQNTQTRLTRDGHNENAYWSPDDAYIYFDRVPRDQPMIIARRRSDGSGAIETVIEDSVAVGNPTLTPDGTVIVYTRQLPGTGWDLYGFRMESGEQFVISYAEGTQSDAHVSPDGQYVVYRSGTAIGSIIVTPLDGSGDIELTDEGGFPVWSADGRYIYFLRGTRNEIYRVPVTTDSVFGIVGNEELVFQNRTHAHFDLLADGTVLLSQRKELAAESGETWVVLNFHDEIERIAPRSR